VSDPFSSFGLTGDSKVSSFGSATLRGAAAMSLTMTQRLNGLKRSSPNDLPLVANQALQITYFKAYGGDRTIVVLFISNVSGQPLVNLAIQIDATAGLLVNFEGDPIPSVRNNVILLPHLAPNGTTTQLACVSCRDATVTAKPVSLTGSVSYAGAPALLRWTVALEVLELLRPLTIDTDRFGSYWKAFNQEKKVTVTSSCTTPADFMNRMKEQLGIHPVRTIGAENIVAGKLVSNIVQENLICLVHGKIQGNTLNVIVRSQSGDFSNVVATYVQRILQ